MRPQQCPAHLALRFEFLAALTLLAALLFPAAAIGGNVALPPSWAIVMPKAEGRVYGVGIAAVSTTSAEALDIAGRVARFEILAQLRSSVRGKAVFETKLFSQRGTGEQENGTRFQRAEVTGEIAVTEISLPGITIEETYLDQDTRTAYVLAYLDLTIARRDCELAYKRLDNASQEMALWPSGSPFAHFLTLHRLKMQADELVSVLTLLHPFIPCGPLCDNSRALQQHLAHSVESAQKRATFGLDARYPVSSEISRIIRAQFEQMGCVWSETSPAMQVAAKVETSEQIVRISLQAFHVRRLMASITIKDADGVPYDSFSFSVKGIGNNAASSRQALQQNFAAEMEERLVASEARMLGSTANLWTQQKAGPD